MDTTSGASSSSSSSSSSSNTNGRRQWGNRNYREKVLEDFRNRKGGNHDQKADIELVRMSTAPSFGQDEKKDKQPNSQPLPTRSPQQKQHRSSSDSALVEPSWSRSLSTSGSSEMSVEKSGDNDNEHDMSLDNSLQRVTTTDLGSGSNTPPTPPINTKKGTLGTSMSIANDDDDDNAVRTPILRSPNKSNNTSRGRIRVLSPPRNIKSPYEVLTEQNERRIEQEEHEKATKKGVITQDSLEDENEGNEGEKTPKLSQPSTPPRAMSLSPITRMSSIKSKSRRKSHILDDDDDYDDDDENMLNFEERKRGIENSKLLRKSNPETPKNERFAAVRDQNLLSLPSFSDSSSVLYSGSEYDSSAASSAAMSEAGSPFAAPPAVYRNDNWNDDRREHQRFAKIRSTRMDSPPSELDSISIDEMSVEQSPQANTPVQAASRTPQSRGATPAGVVLARSVPSTPMTSLPLSLMSRQANMKSVASSPMIKQQPQQITPNVKKSTPNTPIQPKQNITVSRKTTPKAPSPVKDNENAMEVEDEKPLPENKNIDDNTTTTIPSSPTVTMKTVPTTLKSPVKVTKEPEVPAKPKEEKAQNAQPAIPSVVPSSPTKRTSPTKSTPKKGSPSRSPTRRRSPSRTRTLVFTTSPIDPSTTEPIKADAANTLPETTTPVKNSPELSESVNNVVLTQSPPTPPSTYVPGDDDESNDKKAEIGAAEEEEEKAFDKEFSTAPIKSMEWPQTFATSSGGSPLKHTKGAAMSPMKSSLKKAGSRPSTVKKRVSFSSIDDLPKDVVKAIEEDREKSRVDTSLSPSPPKRKLPKSDVDADDDDEDAAVGALSRDEEVKIVKNLSAMFGSDSEDEEAEKGDEAREARDEFDVFRSERVISSTPTKRQDAMRLEYDNIDDEDDENGIANGDSFMDHASPIKKPRISEANSESIIVEGNGDDDSLSSDKVQPTPEKHPLPQLHMSQREALLTNALNSMPGSSFLDETNDLSVNTSGFLGRSPLTSPQKSVFDSVAAIPGTPGTPYAKYLDRAARSIRRSTFSYPKCKYS